MILRVLLDQGAVPDLSTLPADVQTRLAQDVSGLPPIPQAVVDAVLDEFRLALDQVGIAGVPDTETALNQLAGKLSPEVTEGLRVRAEVASGPAPWTRLSETDAEVLAELVDGEAVEVAALVISKLNTASAAALLHLMPGMRARQIACAIPRCTAVRPALLADLGAALCARLDAVPEPAFARAPAARLGDILNSSTAATREDLLDGLGQSDEGFAREVRRAIFTYAHIPARLPPKAVPLVTRALDGEALIGALLAAKVLAPDVEAFFFEHMSPRMAGQIRDEMTDREAPDEETAEAALAEVVMAIRKLEADGAVTLLAEEEP